MTAEQRAAAFSWQECPGGQGHHSEADGYAFGCAKCNAAEFRRCEDAAYERAARVADEWAAKYPVDVFPAESTSLDAKAAGHGRHVARKIAEDLRSLASPGGGR